MLRNFHKMNGIEIKQDIIILHAFCRVTDDMVDNGDSVKLKKERIHIITQFLDQLFANRRITAKYCWEMLNDNTEPNIDWKYFEKHLSEEEVASFRTFSRIAYYMPQEPFYELVDGYNWDIDGRPVLNEDDLIAYANCVASSVATLCVFVFGYKTNRLPDKMGAKCRLMIEIARKIGVVCQTIDIHRDIFEDSETIGRCYIPHSYLTEDELRCLLVDRVPTKIPNIRLKSIGDKIIMAPDRLFNEAFNSIQFVPNENQGAFLSLLKLCQDCRRSIRSNPSYVNHGYLTKWQKTKLVLKSMYFTIK